MVSGTRCPYVSVSGCDSVYYLNCNVEANRVQKCIIVAKALDGQRYPLPLCEYMQCWPKDIRYSLSSDIRIKMVVIFILSFFYSEWPNNHLIFILSFHFLGIILFEKIRITSNNHSFFKMGKNVIS